MRQSAIHGASAPTGFKRWMILCVLWMAATASSACMLDLDLDTDGDRRRITGSGHVVVETRIVSPFSRVSTLGVGRLILEPAETEFVGVRADDNFLPYLRTDVQGGTLFLGLHSGTDLAEVTEIVYTVG